MTQTESENGGDMDEQSGGDWHAVCHDCPDLELVGEFDSVFEKANDHRIDTGHNVDMGNIE